MRFKLIITTLLFAVAMTSGMVSLGKDKNCNLRIGGTVTRNAQGSPAPERRVEVHLYDKSGDLIATVRTDSDGYYAFENVCPGTYTVRPGPAWVANVEGPRLPALYTPSSRRVTVPSKPKDVLSPNHVNFVRNEPPPPDQPDPERGKEEEIRIDESTRAGQDAELAARIRDFLEKNLKPCVGPIRCNLLIKVRERIVELSGILYPNDKPALERIRNIQGVRSVNLDRIRFEKAR